MMSRQPGIPFGLGILAWSFSVQGQTAELMVLKETGPRDKRVNIVIIGDGYMSTEKERFRAHAQTFANGIVEAPPLAGYGNHFNIYAIFAASIQSGADIPAKGITRNTYFNARYDENLGRLLTIDYAKGFDIIDRYVPERDIPVAIVNSADYGGSGGSIAVANHTAPEIIAHEVQHSFTNLGDEYEYPGVTPWEAANTTKAGTRGQVRWKHWVATATPVPTPETAAWNSVIGVFEGAAYNPTGWFRPRQNCRMRENNLPFCTVCSEAILLQVYDRVSPLDSSLPAAKVVAIGGGSAPDLKVFPKQPTTHSMKVEWILDGQPAAGMAGTAFTQALSPGIHRVTARVSDPTPLVRLDGDKVLRDSVSWTVNVSAVTGGRDAETGPDLPRLLAAGRGRVSFNLPSAGGYRISAITPGGRLAWALEVGSGHPGRNGLACDLMRENREPGLYWFILEQGGKTDRKRFLVLE